MEAIDQPTMDPNTAMETTIERIDTCGFREASIMSGVNMFKASEGEILHDGCVRNICGVLVNLGE